MAYTTINKSTDYFNTKLYTGNGSTQSITGVGFSDWVWIKSRSDTSNHRIYDAVRGGTKTLYSNLTNAQGTNADAITSFDSDGFTLGANAQSNGNGLSLASWNWKANGTGSANTDGSITSTVSANTTSGFSIVKWTAGSGVSGIGHGLGVIPKLIICKNLSVSSAWTVGSDLLNDWGGYLGLQSTNALNSETRMYKPSGYSSPTASLFYQDHSAFGSAGEDMIAYCFAEKTGYSKFGSYTGNGSTDGTFVYTGFKPAFVMIKCSSSGGSYTSWSIFDTTRQTFNVNSGKTLYANRSYEEGKRGQGDASTTIPGIDMLSNGFKCRVLNDEVNNTAEYIYMAFGQSLVGSNNVPCTAR